MPELFQGSDTDGVQLCDKLQPELKTLLKFGPSCNFIIPTSSTNLPENCILSLAFPAEKYSRGSSSGTKSRSFPGLPDFPKDSEVLRIYNSSLKEHSARAILVFSSPQKYIMSIIWWSHSYLQQSSPGISWHEEANENGGKLPWFWMGKDLIVFQLKLGKVALLAAWTGCCEPYFPHIFIITLVLTWSIVLDLLVFINRKLCVGLASSTVGGNREAGSNDFINLSAGVLLSFVH